MRDIIYEKLARSNMDYAVLQCSVVYISCYRLQALQTVSGKALEREALTASMNDSAYPYLYGTHNAVPVHSGAM